MGVSTGIMMKKALEVSDMEEGRHGEKKGKCGTYLPVLRFATTMHLGTKN